MADLSNLRRLMRALRDTHSGCPWDLAQSWDTIVPHTLEEAYEVADVIESGEFGLLPGELGDLLFQVVFYCQLGEEQERFAFEDVVAAIEHKLIERHPHVFGAESGADIEQVAGRWEALKAAERRARAAASELDDVPLALPALSRARKIQKRAARVGFDWPDIDGAWAKLDEELAELAEARAADQDPEAVIAEFGDLLFSAVNVGRHLGIDAEGALRAATARFEQRFRHLESALAARGVRPEEAGEALLEELWEAAKRAQKETGAEAPVTDQREERGHD